MTAVNLSSYKNLYIKTAKEYLDVLEKDCISISQNLSDTKVLKSMHLSAHSIKSQSEVMQYFKTAALSGMIEKILKDIIDKNKKLSDELLNVFKEAIENIKLSIQSIENKNTEINTDIFVKKLEAIFHANLL